jgi:hypothetical protein
MIEDALKHLERLGLKWKPIAYETPPDPHIGYAIQILFPPNLRIDEIDNILKHLAICDPQSALFFEEDEEDEATGVA